MGTLAGPLGGARQRDRDRLLDSAEGSGSAFIEVLLCAELCSETDLYSDPESIGE